MRALFILTHEERVRRRYVDALRSAFPDIEVQVVDHHAKACERIESVDVLLTFGTMMSDDVLKRASRLKWIQVLGTGTDGVVDQPSLRPDVLVTRVRGIHGPAMSEAALAAMLALGRDLPRSLRCQQRRSWERWPSTLLSGKTVGILGMGAIAEALAPRCKALGMTVVGLSATPREAPGFDRTHARSRLNELAGEFDFLVVLVPLSPQTRRLVDARTFASMKPTSFLVNLARGGIVDESALVAALESGAIAGAALDVFEEEPLPEASPLWSARKLIVTTHLGGYYDRYADDVMPLVVENMRLFIAGDIAGMRHKVERNAATHWRRQT